MNALNDIYSRITGQFPNLGQRITDANNYLTLKIRSVYKNALAFLNLISGQLTSWATQVKNYIWTPVPSKPPTTATDDAKAITDRATDEAKAITDRATDEAKAITDKATDEAKAITDTATNEAKAITDTATAAAKNQAGSSRMRILGSGGLASQLMNSFSPRNSNLTAADRNTFG